MVAFYKHHIPAWMDGTEKLDDGAYRAYHVICQLIYLNDGPIALNEKGIAGRCNQHVLAFRRHLDVLLDLGKLHLHDGKLSNDRAATELQRIDNLRATSAKGGRRSAEVRRTYEEGHADKPLELNEPPSTMLLEDLNHKTRQEKTRKKDGAEAPIDVDLFQPSPPPKQEAPDARVYRRGREVLGKNSGGVVTNLIRFKDGNLNLAMAALETASTKDRPIEYLQRLMKPRTMASTGPAEVEWRSL